MKKVNTVAEFLRAYLEWAECTQNTLAAALDVSRLTVNQLCNGKREVTFDMAHRLSEVIGGSPMFWIVLQARERLGRTAQFRRKIMRMKHFPSAWAK